MMKITTEVTVLNGYYIAKITLKVRHFGVNSKLLGFLIPVSSFEWEKFTCYNEALAWVIEQKEKALRNYVECKNFAKQEKKSGRLFKKVEVVE